MDWKKHIREHLAPLRLGTEREPEILWGSFFRPARNDACLRGLYGVMSYGVVSDRILIAEYGDA